MVRILLPHFVSAKVPIFVHGRAVISYPEGCIPVQRIETKTYDEAKKNMGSGFPSRNDVLVLQRLLDKSWRLRRMFQIIK